uniref:5'-3' exoribonuclease 1-like n=1 Tax=Hirondellea gigas TaxID=1518452 RepID=A0A2P2I0F3_9CRUS
MGVPKFYRWISERYPTLSEVVRDFQIPDFDNLYLDMNGIIHTCSHPNDADPHFRITEEQIIKDIFHYIEVLFRMIQPQKVFFMAIDGVAPRAKMNQQRGRRFRSAREAEDNEAKARSKGEVLPTEARFDSNCITPGTEFMDRLDKQLQYFVTNKISTDSMWQNCSVIYSGHQTPGEGEHKIMEYIRYSRSQPGYDSNTRHCLYGLDADLMMLGLTSHDPHFSLLREEVKFGGRKEATKRTPTAEETTFHLLHLSLMREYINYEFVDVKDKLPFKYDIESIIDDWVLMGFLVGNDFIPHLPTLHINKDALPLLFETYKSVLPTLDGYLNERGKLNLVRFEKFMLKLADYDRDNFSDMNADLKYFNDKKISKKTATQRAGELEGFFNGDEDVDDNNGLFGSLEGDSTGKPMRKEESASETLARLGIHDQPLYNELDEQEDEEVDPLVEEFRQHKRNYYIEKMHYKDDDNFKLVAHEQAINYVRGIQWILHYYYDGIASWSWYYPFHYAPYISDIKSFSRYPVEFELGKPFKPFEQLLAVLPPLSVKLLPQCYASIMLNEDSPVIDFYPRTFETDLNGKQQDWEAVVLIPFIDEKRLLDAMATQNHRLSADENRRTQHGPMFLFTHTPLNLGTYKSPGYFPNVGANHASLSKVFRAEWEMEREQIYKGLCPGVRLDLYFAGFPTLKHLNHTFRREMAAVKVFQQNSRGESVILELEDTYQAANKPREWLSKIGQEMINKVVFVGWPHLREAKVVGVSSSRYSMSVQKGGDGAALGPVVDAEFPDEIEQPGGSHWRNPAAGSGGSAGARFDACCRNLSQNMLNRWGVDAKQTSLIFYCKPMTGRRYIPGPGGKMTLSHDWSYLVQPYLAHTVVMDISVHDPGYAMHRTIAEHFPSTSRVFMLGQPHYGCIGTVMEGNEEQEDRGRVRIQLESYPEPDLALLRTSSAVGNRYMTAYQLAQKIGISPHLVIRITGSVLMVPPQDPTKPFLDTSEYKNKTSIGLNLRNNKRNEEVRGLSQRDSSNTWLYSDACLQLLLAYNNKFPRVFSYLNQHNSDVYQDNVFTGETGAEDCAALLAWLKESEVDRADKQRCGTEQLPEESVAELKTELQRTTLRQTLQHVKMQVKAHLLYKPNPLQGSTPVDGPIKTELWDRLINVRDGYSVPLGARGTVVGIQPAKEQSEVLYDVMFDNSFSGGLTFAGPASSQCCYRLYWSAFINLSAKTRPKDAAGNQRRDNRQQDSYQNPSRYNNQYSNVNNNSDVFQRSWPSAHNQQSYNNGRSNNSSNNRNSGSSNIRSNVNNGQGEEHIYSSNWNTTHSSNTGSNSNNTRHYNNNNNNDPVQNSNTTAAFSSDTKKKVILSRNVVQQQQVSRPQQQQEQQKQQWPQQQQSSRPQQQQGSRPQQQQGSRPQQQQGSRPQQQQWTQQQQLGSQQQQNRGFQQQNQQQHSQKMLQQEDHKVASQVKLEVGDDDLPSNKANPFLQSLLQHEQIQQGTTPESLNPFMQSLLQHGKQPEQQEKPKGNSSAEQSENLPNKIQMTSTSYLLKQKQQRDLLQQQQQMIEQRSESPQPPDPKYLPSPSILTKTSLSSTERNSQKSVQHDSRNQQQPASYDNVEQRILKTPSENDQQRSYNKRLHEQQSSHHSATKPHGQPNKNEIEVIEINASEIVSGNVERASPAQLQKQAHFKELEGAQRHRYNNQRAPKEVLIYNSPGQVPISYGGVQEVTTPSQVECIVHGTYYSRWSVTQQYGLNRGNSQHIPCLSYDPLTSSRARPSDSGYHLIIYIDVATCLAEGMKFLVLPAGQVLCTGDANGKVLPHCFDRVVDTSSNKVIFPRVPNKALPSSGCESQWRSSSDGSMSPFMPTQVIKQVSSKTSKQKQTQGNKQSPPTNKSPHRPKQPNTGMQNQHSQETSHKDVVSRAQVDASSYGEVPVAQLVNLEEPSVSSSLRAAVPVLRQQAVKSGGETLSGLTQSKKPTRRLACNFSK